MPPPWMLTTSSDRPSSACDTRDDGAERLVDLDDVEIVRRDALLGAAPSRSRGQAARAASCRGRRPGRTAPTTASTGQPFSSACDRVVRTTADAPSEICDELPAVIDPPSAKAGRRPASVSTVVSGRMPSSFVTTTGAPLRCGISTGDDLGVEDAARLRRGGALMRARGDGILRLAGDLEVGRCAARSTRPCSRGRRRRSGRRTPCGRAPRSSRRPSRRASP